jgi:hypothetical protein
MWWDADSTIYIGCTIGGGSMGTQNYRLYAIGDDGGQSVSFFFRYLSGNTDDHSVSFGIPNDETTPLPDDDAARLFTIGSSNSGNNGSYLNNISFACGGGFTGDRATGMSWGPDVRQPVSAAYSCWCYGASTSVNSTPAFSAQAGDSPFSGTTELLKVEILQGLEDDQFTGTRVLEQVPRVIGTVPFVRQGRTNFSDYTLTDDKAWLHLQNEVWVEWQGPSVL